MFRGVVTECKELYTWGADVIDYAVSKRRDIRVRGYTLCAVTLVLTNYFIIAVTSWPHGTGGI